MTLTFLNHQWKAFWRSRNKAGSIAAQIVLGFFILYFLVVALAIGIAMEKILGEVFRGQDVLTSFNGIILYYFAADFMARIQLQELPTMSVVPYLHIRIPRSKIISFLNTKAFFSAFNLWPVLLFLPFCITHIGPEFGGFAACMYMVAILSLTMFSNFCVLYIKRKSITSALYTLVGLFLIGVLAALEYYDVISITRVSDTVFRLIAEQPLSALAFTVLAGAMFWINSSYLRNNLYTEELSVRREKKASTDYPFLNRFGSVGELAALELKLILRHKRSRSSMVMGFVFLLYGFIFYKEPMLVKDEFGKMLFAAVFMTGITILTYGQFMFAWQSAHFDGLLSNKINYKDYIKAKFLLFTISCTIITILSSFYGFLSPKLLLLHLVSYLYNMGFGTVIVLYFATLNYKRLDIAKSASFNFQGTGATQWILSIPFVLIPFMIYLPVSYFYEPYTGLYALGTFGILTLLFRGFWVDLLTKRFEKQRYRIAEGFRE